MSKVGSIKSNAQTESFNKKIKLMGIGIKEQCVSLNKLYNEKIKFALDNEEKIIIEKIDDSIRILELPECENIDFRYTGTESNNIETLKLPKCLKEIDIHSIIANFHKIKSLWVWDYQVENIKEKTYGWYKIDLFIRSEKSNKVRIVKNYSC